MTGDILKYFYTTLLRFWEFVKNSKMTLSWPKMPIRNKFWRHISSPTSLLYFGPFWLFSRSQMDKKGLSQKKRRLSPKLLNYCDFLTSIHSYFFLPQIFLNPPKLSNNGNCGRSKSKFWLLSKISKQQTGWMSVKCPFLNLSWKNN